jgi:cell wall-associated NlpC family hydrolase
VASKEEASPGLTHASLLVPCPETNSEATTCVRASANVLLCRLTGTPSPGELAVRTAQEYLATPYVFGGRSRLGIDCSGLTGAGYASVGLTLPRDARQQILVGKLAAAPWHLQALRPGDLLFFCDDTGRVIHTALSLGGMRFIHASPPQVQINSLDPADPLYSEFWRKYFAFARRPLP